MAVILLVQYADGFVQWDADDPTRDIAILLLRAVDKSRARYDIARGHLKSLEPALVKEKHRGKETTYIWFTM